eukprot:gene29465-5812_t
MSSQSASIRDFAKTIHVVKNITDRKDTGSLIRVNVPGVMTEIDGTMRSIDIDIDIDSGTRLVEVVFVSIREALGGVVINRAMWGGNRLINKADEK